MDEKENILPVLQLFVAETASHLRHNGSAQKTIKIFTKQFTGNERGCRNKNKPAFILL